MQRWHSSNINKPKSPIPSKTLDSLSFCAKINSEASFCKSPLRVGIQRLIKLDWWLNSGWRRTWTTLVRLGISKVRKKSFSKLLLVHLISTQYNYITSLFNKQRRFEDSDGTLGFLSQAATCHLSTTHGGGFTLSRLILSVAKQWINQFSLSSTNRT